MWLVPVGVQKVYFYLIVYLFWGFFLLWNSFMLPCWSFHSIACLFICHLFPLFTPYLLHSDCNVSMSVSFYRYFVDYTREQKEKSFRTFMLNNFPWIWKKRSHTRSDRSIFYFLYILYKSEQLNLTVLYSVCDIFYWHLKFYWYVSVFPDYYTFILYFNRWVFVS